MRRTAESLLVWLLTGLAACGSGAAAPAPACKASQASQVVLAVGGDTSLDPSTDAGCATFPANASSVDSAEYLVVPQSTGGNPGGTAAFSLVSITPTASAPAPVASTTRPSTRSAAVAFDQLLRQLGHAHAPAARAPSTHPLASAVVATIVPPTVGSLRTFTVCANRLNCGLAQDFKTVRARAVAVGAHVAIYVDTLAPANGLDSADIDTLKQVFDARLYPLATDTFGAVSDIDSNGVVIALMTPVVNALVTKTECLSSGYVAGFFFPLDLDGGAPAFQSNRAEIFYSIAADPTGTVSCAHPSTDVKNVLPTTFIHELQHMINYAEHILIQFLIPNDDGTLADIGASWLFVRYLMDQYGSTLAGKLDKTTLAGATNVATQTGQSFATLVERWALANWVSDLPGFTAPSELRYSSWSFGAEFDSLHLNAHYASLSPPPFPVPFPLVPPAVAGGQVDVTGSLNAGSDMYVRALQGPGAGSFSLLLAGPSAAALPRGCPA